MARILTTTLTTLVLGASIAAQDHPAITSWLANRDGRTGSSTNSAIHAVVSRVRADVQRIAYDTNNAYVQATGIPSYPVGPWGRNPNMATGQNFVFRIPFAPQVQSGTKTDVGLGLVGVLVNGVAVFNAEDGRSYRNLRIWNQDAYASELRTFDSAGGHPQQRGIYHHHIAPASLRAQLCDDGTHHSPLLGYAFDGFPIYGPYGFAKADGSGGVRRINSSYRKRNITQRTILPDGTRLQPSQYGPAVSTQYPLGTYIEDFEYVKGLGDLDVHNGRFGVTPEYPKGTYAYFMTLDAKGTPAYPYCLGPTYYGVFITENARQRVTIPGNATTYNGGRIDCSGKGCPSAKPLSLHYGGIAALGRSYAVELRNGPSSGVGFVVIGAQTSSPYPIDLSGAGWIGCSLYQSLDVLFGVGFKLGAASLGLSVPKAPALSGLKLATQGFAFDASAPGGLSASQAGVVTIGG